MNLTKTGVAYDNRSYHPAASAYDRGYECAQALRGHAEGPHPQLQAVRSVSEAITRHGSMRGYPRLPAGSGPHADEHLYPQPHHTRLAVLVKGEVGAIGPCARDLSHPGAAEASASDERRRDEAIAG